MAAQRTPTAVDVLDPPLPEAFRRQYFARRKPVLLRGLLRSWPALRTWTPERFARDFGEQVVEVMCDLRQNRPEDPTPYGALARMPVAQFAALVANERAPPDLYCAAQNRWLRQPAFAALWQDLHFDPAWFDARATLGVSMWFGPKGTVTPLHFDRQDVLLAQVRGAKHVLLAPPQHTPWLYPARGAYAAVDPEAPDLARFARFTRARFRSVAIEPGDALFIPYGWWHHVRALTQSISLSLSNFAWSGVGDERTA